MSKFMRSQLWWVIVAVPLIGQAFGQGGATGAISGTVQDATGAVIANADVRIINQDTGTVTRAIKTDATGSFTATLLPVGTYTISISNPGFQEGKFSDIAVRVTETTRMTAKLRPMQVLEKIEVQALVQAVETTSATTGQAIEARTIRDLPLATQNFQQLLTLSTGAQSELNASSQLGRGATKIFVNGQREDNNNYQIEGISATDYNVAQGTNVPLPNPDVLGEFKVQTSLYDASEGRNGGGNVNAILKSGTKTFHGDAYEFLRNDVLNANEYFQKAAGRSRPPVKQNIFGGSFGGPVGKEAQGGFFFVNYQGTRQRSALSPGTLINTTLPVIPASVRVDATMDAQLEAAFNVSVIDPVVHKLLLFKSNQFGAPAGGYLFPALQGNLGDPPEAFITSKTGRYTDDQFTATWDREFRGGNDKLSARFFFSNSESLLPFGAGGLQASLGATLASSINATDLDFPYDLPINARFLSIDETHLFSPALVNDFRFGYVRINNSLQNIPPVTATDLGIDRPTNNVTNSIYKFTLNSSGFQLGPSPTANQYQTQNNYNFVDNVSWVRRVHTISFGGEATRVNLDKLFPQVFNGQLIFANSGGLTGLTDFQQFLEGAPPFSFGGGGVYNHQYRANDFAFYGQDLWKVRPDFTFNYGLRVEMLGAFHDNLCHIGNLDPALANQGQYPFVFGSCAKSLNVTGLTGSGNNTTYHNNYATGLAPRIGFAWDLFGRHTTSLRGGFGIYYVREDVGSVDQLSFQAPFLPVAFGGGLPGCASTFFSADAPANCIPAGQTSNPNALPKAGVIDPNFIPCLALFQGFPGNDSTQAPSFACNGPGIPSTGVFGLIVPRHFVTPSTGQWNLTLQRELAKQWILEVGYVGTHSIHLRETRTSLQAQNVTNNPITIKDQTGHPYQIIYNTINNGPARSRSLAINGYSGMQLFANDAYSHYHSLQATISRRWGAGYFQGAYTFSRSTDATSSGNTAFNTAFNDESTIDASRGLSDFDRTHRLAVSYRYDIPSFGATGGAKGAMLRGWSISGITIFQSGTPFSVIDSAAGTGFLGSGLTTTLGAALVSGGSIAAGKTSGDIHNRLNGYLNINNFAMAPLLYPNDPANPNTTCDPVHNSNFCGTSFGDLGRNIYRGPHQQNWDFSLIKNFRLTERQSLRFTTDFFNIWNHSNFASPAQSDVENTSTFSKITQTVGTPRLIQFSLRYAF